MTRSISDVLLLSLITAVLLSGCGGGAASQASEEEEHEHGGTAVTRWSEKTELFFEYPPMVADVQGEPWAIHLTKLSDFSPVAGGTLTLAFRSEDGTVFTTRANAPARPGIYTPAPVLPAAGTYELAMAIDGDQLSDRIQVGEIQVYATESDVPHEEEAEQSGGIAFLKEQQWPIPFGVAEAGLRTISETVEVNGDIVPAADGMAVVVAPVSGLAEAGRNLSAPALGDRVQAGQTLVILSPTTQDNSFARAKASAEQLEREVARLTRLYEVEAIPEKRLVEARHDLDVAQAALSAMGGAGDAGYTYSVRAPISGVVQARQFSPGQRVEAGETLFEIVRPETVWLRLQIPARRASIASGVGASIFSVEGDERRLTAERVVSTGSSIDPETRTLPVVLEVDNRDGLLKIGQFATAWLRVGDERTGVTIPNEAIVNEDGQPVAYVQTGGETFERRLLTTGPTDGFHTIVESGVASGDHVVTEGAYQVYLGSLSTDDIADHGHAH